MSTREVTVDFTGSIGAVELAILNWCNKDIYNRRYGIPERVQSQCSESNQPLCIHVSIFIEKKKKKEIYLYIMLYM